ncbi:hypothetical protein RJZ56_002661 [Blastomyces dermatitidis]|uniref:Ser/Thr protein phosphatase n=1 Tax=Blastomyces gilchristii (strain SLH14081) TaxID=559298 RepID=A0A179UZ52_BLAGS|nr:Ser/Thr protein phosphatase [Blastomyces gilchristii SLH14081]OAT13120.1 Ser/Thr protein phosphatase [Blastomyces gilchristii SLH14081]
MLTALLSLLGLQITWIAAPIWACDSCYGPSDYNVHKRLVRRMQPEALNAMTKPKGPLEWGQINFIHTTDTHGWLAGHLKEQNYGADWGDFVSFIRNMRKKAHDLKVDLLVVDTGDLHDGNGLSDITTPNGAYSTDIFSQIDYDLLTVGNHELYVTEVAYDTFANFSSVYGPRYLTSNVQILNDATGEFVDLGHKYRHFTTTYGLRIMAFGVLFNFQKNSNVSRITKAEDMIKEKWFTEAVMTKDVDLFVVIGHNPVRNTEPSSTLTTIQQAIRGMRPDKPIQIFGGHAHVRDFVVWDETSTGLASGRYCETVGWLSMSGIKSPTFKGSMKPHGVPNPSRKAIVKKSAWSQVPKHSCPEGEQSMLYSRRYLDWNRLTFAYHAAGSQDPKFDTHLGKWVTGDITEFRKANNLSTVLACVPKTYCATCKPFGEDGNIFKVLEEALAATVVNPSRADKPRLILTNTGSIRFDLIKGPFTLDDAYITSPFKNSFQFIPEVPYTQAKQVLDILNAGPFQKKRSDNPEVDTYSSSMLAARESCVDPPLITSRQMRRDLLKPRSITRHRQDETQIYPGYTTTDDFGTDGDDTPHSMIPHFPQPNDVQANASFPTDGSEPENVDLVFVSFIGKNYVLPAVNQAGGSYTAEDLQLYTQPDFTADMVLMKYAEMVWKEGVPDCPVALEP